jgi:Ca-activated chloride channel family protein
MIGTELVFARTEFLWAAIGTPLVLLVMILFYLSKRKKLEKFADQAALERVAASFSSLRFFIKAVALTLTFLFLMLAAAQPKYGLKSMPVKRKGVDLIIALDVSKSMDTADVPPSRLYRARKSIETLLNKLAGDRIGLVVFAGEAVLLHPLTTRSTGFLITLETLETNIVGTPGTALGESIKEARKSFETNTLRNKILIVITDGETHDENAVEQAKQAKAEGIKIFTLGIGTPEGEPVPDYESEGQTVYMKEKGRYIISKLNTSLLQEIAAEADGAYYHFAGGENELEKLYNNVAQMGKEEETDQSHDVLEDIYQYPLAVAMMALLLALLIGDKKRERKK